MAKSEIVNLEASRKNVARIYEHTRDYVDAKTGEVVSNVHTFLKKSQTQDEFVKLFIENIAFVNENLTDAEIRILLHAVRNLNYVNSFRFDNNFIGYFTSNKILAKSTIYKHFKGLVEKNIFLQATSELKKQFDLYGDDVYFINPDIVGRGSFRELKELRRTIIQTFDFDKLEMKQEVVNETKYNGYEDIVNSPDKHQISEVKQEISKDGKTKTTEVAFENKPEKSKTDVINADVKDSSQSLIDNKKKLVEDDQKLEILRLEKEKLEAENK